jgi:hypothetical protein
MKIVKTALLFAQFESPPEADKPSGGGQALRRRINISPLMKTHDVYFYDDISQQFGFGTCVVRCGFYPLDLMIFIKLPAIGICRQIGYNAFNPIAWVGCIKV